MIALRCPGSPKDSRLDEVLDDVVTGKCEAALVDIAHLETYHKFKPGLGKQLKVLAESELLPPAVIVCRKGALDRRSTPEGPRGAAELPQNAFRPSIHDVLATGRLQGRVPGLPSAARPVAEGIPRPGEAQARAPSTPMMPARRP